MPSDYRLIIDGTPIFLHNQTGVPVVGGNIHHPTTTPLVVVADDWRPSPPEAALVTGGDDQALMALSYAPIVEPIPLLCRASSGEQVAQILATLNRHATLTTAPAVLWCQPHTTTQPILFAISRVEARALPLANGTDPAEGATDIAITLRVRRSPWGGLASLMTLLSATSVTNSSATSLGTLIGDMAAEGQPLIVRLDTPTSQRPIRVILASIHSRTTATIGSTLTGVTTMSGSAFTASSSISAVALRQSDGLHLRVLARLTGITSPTKAQIRVRAETPSGGTLWQGPWVGLDSATATQLIDLDGTTLDMLRVAVGSAPAIVLRAELRSIDGTSVTATLASLEALWCYDYASIELASAMGVGQRLYALGADAAVSGGPYLPLAPAVAQVADSSDIPTQPGRIRGQLPRAVVGAALFVAWVESGGAHTAADTASLTIQTAPLWRSVRTLS